MKALSIFFAVFAAIVVSVFVFAPEKLPSGVGVSPIPIEATVRPSFLAQGQVAGLKNTSSKTLHNVIVVLRNNNDETVKRLERENWPPGEYFELGWLEGWQVIEGSQLKVSASGHYPQAWKY